MQYRLLTKSVLYCAWAIFSLFLWMGLFATVQAKDYISQKAVWVDSSSQTVFKDAIKQDFKPYFGLLANGYTPSAQWIRLGIDPVNPNESKSQENSLVIRIRPLYLDQIELYDPLSEDKKPQVTGDRYPFNANGLGSLNHTFEIESSSNFRYVYLRLVTSSSSLLVVEAFDLKSFYAADRIQEYIYSMVLSIQLLLFFWVLIGWLGEKDRLSQFFLIKQLFFIVQTLCFFGFHRMILADYVQPSSLDELLSLLTVMVLFIGLFYEYIFLSEYQVSMVFLWVLRFLICLCVFNILSLLLGFVQPALMRNNWMVLIVTVTLFLTALSIQPRVLSVSSKRYELQKFWIVSYYGVIILTTGFGVLAIAGFTQLSEVTLHASVVYSFVSGLFMTVLVQYRSHMTRMMNQEIANQLILVTKQADLEREMKEDQKHFVTMLMHEIKNPLAVIDMSMSLKKEARQVDFLSAASSRAIKDIKSIIDRCVEYDQLNESAAQTKPQHFDFIDFIESAVKSFDFKNILIVKKLEGPCPIVSDRHYVEIIVNNLIDNAVKYCDPEHSIEVILELLPSPEGQAGVRLCVANYPGTASWPDSTQVFQKYYRAKGAMKKAGTGLGLFLIASLAKKIGATCQYVPSNTQVRFELWLPA